MACEPMNRQEVWTISWSDWESRFPIHSCREYSMRYVCEKSERVRALVTGILAEANIVRRDFASRLQGVKSPATAYRLLTTSQPLNDQHVDLLLKAAAEVAGVPTPRLYIALRRPFKPPLFP